MKRYLSIPGAILLITAFIRSAVNAEWDSTNVALAVAGAVVILVTVIWNHREVVEWVRDPRGVFAVTTGIAVAVLLAAILMVNIVVWYNPWSVDLTASGRNEVSAETRAILAGLDEPVVLRQFGRTPQMDQLLRSFQRESRQLRLEVADPDRDRDQSVKYGISRSGMVVVLAGDTFRTIEEPNEQALVTAIVQATSNTRRVVCFVTGHGERGIEDKSAAGLSTLRAILDASNYQTRPISLLEGDVPAECEAVVVAGAREAYTPDELARLSQYTDRHGRVAVLLEPDPAPSFAELLRPRGIVPGPGRVFDASGAGSSLGLGATAPLAINYPDHPVTRAFGLPTVYDGARSLNVLPQPEQGGRPTRLAETSPRSFATTRQGSFIGFDDTQDQRGPLALAAATTIGSASNGETRLAVFGDSDFIANPGLRFNGNRDIFLRTLAWLLGEQEATFVSVENRENRRILLTQATIVWMYLVNLGALPLIPLVAGIVVYIRSRR